MLAKLVKFTSITFGFLIDISLVVSETKATNINGEADLIGNFQDEVEFSQIDFVFIDFGVWLKMQISNQMILYAHILGQPNQWEYPLLPAKGQIFCQVSKIGNVYIRTGILGHIIYATGLPGSENSGPLLLRNGSSSIFPSTVAILCVCPMFGQTYVCIYM